MMIPGVVQILFDLKLRIQITGHGGAGGLAMSRRLVVLLGGQGGEVTMMTMEMDMTMIEVTTKMMTITMTGTHHEA